MNKQHNILFYTTKNKSDINKFLNFSNNKLYDGEKFYYFKEFNTPSEGEPESRKLLYNAVVIDSSIGEKNILDFIELITTTNYRFRLISTGQIIIILRPQDYSLNLILKFGQKNIGSLIEFNENFSVKKLLAVINKVNRNKNKGKTALCLAGGAIEGLIYELGVLRSLDNIIDNKSILDFDMYFGISAGAVISSLLANNIPPFEISKAFMGDSTMIKRIKPSMLYDLAFKDMLLNLGHFVWNGVSSKNFLKQITGILPNAIFSGNKIEQIIEKELSRDNRSNFFQNLEKELYIGTTDQDTYEHILFGDTGWKHIPISKAVHASISLIPFYAPQWISGRWFIDGSFTRTSEVEEAIKKGATLIIIIDPLVPIKSPYTGFVKSKGGVYASIQALKALIHTRFSEVLPRLTQMYPDVDFFVFTPQENDMELLSGNPVRYNYRMKIERIAYFNTNNRINEEKLRFKEAMNRHGFTLKNSI